MMDAASTCMRETLKGNMKWFTWIVISQMNQVWIMGTFESHNLLIKNHQLIENIHIYNILKSMLVKHVIIITCSWVFWWKTVFSSNCLVVKSSTDLITYTYTALAYNVCSFILVPQKFTLFCKMSERLSDSGKSLMYFTNTLLQVYPESI